MPLSPSQESSHRGYPRRSFVILSAATLCFFIGFLIADEVDAQRRGSGGGGFRGGFGRGSGGGYGGFRQAPTFRPPPVRQTPSVRTQPAPPRLTPRQPIPGSGIAPQSRSRQKSVNPQAPVTSLKGFTGRTTKTGSPIIQTSQGKRYAVPQSGISTSLNTKQLAKSKETAQNISPQYKQRITKVALQETFNKAGTSLSKYSPVTDPGPLHSDIASTFRSSTYSELVLRKPKILYRTYSDDGKELGSFWSTRKVKGLGAAMGSAIDSKWGNKATKTVKIVVPAGTRIYVGWAASQVDFTKSVKIASDGASGGYLHGSLVGGGRQVYIEKVEPSWVKTR